MTPEEKIIKAIEMLVSYGSEDGSHHKMWAIDQAVRILAGDDYERVIDQWKRDPHEPDNEELWHEWDEGIAP